MSLPSDISWTEEQRAILDSCPEPFFRTPKGHGQRCRITAAAGTGKTTTLLGLAVEGARKGHKHVTYLTFTKAAADDGKRRIQKTLQKAGFAAGSVLVDAQTIHSCAQKTLKEHLDGDNVNGLWKDKQVKEWIAHQLVEELETFLQPCFRVIDEHPKDSAQQKNDKKESAREQVLFFVYKTLEHFCRRDWTREKYADEKTFGRVYYPAIMYHDENQSLGFKAMKTSFYAEQAHRLWGVVEAQNLRSYNFEMKRVQLLGLQVPGTLLLVDESQDMDQCQVDWLARRQVELGSQVYVVGDAAQTIFGFRGAKSAYVMDLKCDVDHMLAKTWRFGDSIARIANCVLFAKHKSPQSEKGYDGRYKHWLPYRVQAGLTSKYSLVTEESLILKWRQHKQVTLIAFRNATLVKAILPLLGFVENDDNLLSEEDGKDEDEVEKDADVPLVTPDRSVSGESNDETRLKAAPSPGEETGHAIDDFPKIHVNGRGESSGLNVWKGVYTQIEHVFRLHQLESLQIMILPINNFPEFKGRPVSWGSFIDECQAKEITRYAPVVDIVQRYREKTMDAMQVFKDHVMDGSYTAEEADIVLTTCHSAKGMEWDNVEICNDFIDLGKYKSETKDVFVAENPMKPFGKRRKVSRQEWMFDVKNWGDDVNLLYVACTRAKRTLTVPLTLTHVLRDFDGFHRWQLSAESADGTVADLGRAAGVQMDDGSIESLCKSLVNPLRNEQGLESGKLLMDTLLSPLPEDENDMKDEKKETTLLGNPKNLTGIFDTLVKEEPQSA